MKTKLLKIAGVLGIYLLLWTILNHTDPHNLALPLIIIPFTLIFIGFYIPLYLLIKFISATFDKAATKDNKKARFLALVGASMPTFLLVLSSINQLTLKDLILWLILITGIVFYGSRTSFARR